MFALAGFVIFGLAPAVLAAGIAIDVEHYLAKPGATSARGVYEFPVLLFEAGVIVNREEELKMRDSALRKQMVAGAAACLR